MRNSSSKTVTAKEYCIELCVRIRAHTAIIEEIGYVDKNITAGQRRAVACKLGHKQRVEALTKTKESLFEIEAYVLNGDRWTMEHSRALRRVRRSLGQIYGKNTKLSIGGVVKLIGGGKE